MNPAVKGIVRMHMRDRFAWFFLPWIIVLSSFAINLIIAGAVENEKTVTGGLASIFVYMMVSGILAVQHTFPFAIGLSVRRRDFYNGTLLMIAAASVVTGIVLTLLSSIESASDGWGVELYFFHLPYITDGNAFQQWFIFVSLVLFMYMFGFAISCLFRRFGKTGLYAAGILALIVGTLVMYAIIHMGWWKDIADFLDGRTAFDLALMLLPAPVVFACVSYALLRRSTV